MLDPGATRFTFQFFIDNEALKNDAARSRSVTGWDHLPITDPELQRRNEAGGGVYCTVNETDFGGRSIKNIVRVRAVFQEDDDGYTGSFPIEPTFVVESSPGHFHRYWSITGDWPANDAGKRDFRGVMERMIADYASCPGAKDISRVLRVPGFYHLKGEPFLVRIVKVHPQLRRYTREEILAAFPPIIPEPRHRIPEHRGGPRVALASGNVSGRLRGLIESVTNAAEGERNRLLFWASNRLHDMALLGEITKSEFTQACGDLLNAATGAGLSAQEAQRTIASAMR
jgi:hypothetical protein